MKLDALQKATAAADPVIRNAMMMLAVVAVSAQRSTLAQLVGEYNAAERALDATGGATASNVMAAVAAASRLDAALALRTSDVFTKVGAAHSALTTALQNPNPSFADVLVTLEAVIVEARNIQEIANALAATNR